MKTDTLANRFAASLDIDGPNLANGLWLDGFRLIRDRAEHAVRHFEHRSEELVHIDIIAKAARGLRSVVWSQ